jgi:hypothetical protein
MPWYYRAKAAINAAVPFLVPTQKTNLALLVSAILKKRKTRTLSASPNSLELTRRPKNGGWPPPSTACCIGSKGSGASPTTSESTPWRCNSISWRTPLPNIGLSACVGSSSHGLDDVRR